MDLNFTARQFDKIVTILKSWIEKEEIEWEEVIRRLKKIKIDIETIDWLMEKVNAMSVKDVEKKLLQEIEEYEAYSLNY